MNTEAIPEGYVLVPIKPTDGLLMSMAIRYDHGLGCPGYYDQPMFKQNDITHDMHLKSTLITMRQLHEEVVGTGFYSAEREQEYVDWQNTPTKKEGNPYV